IRISGMAMRQCVASVSMKSKITHARVLNLLAIGTPMIQVRDICESSTENNLDLARKLLSKIQSREAAHPHRALIPELVRAIGVGERTLELCRPPAA
ncbi:hypothetical protein PMAYCL1PPCAC_00056, partial [Pristionchus mayeri]